MAVQFQAHEPVAIGQYVPPSIFEIVTPCACLSYLADCERDVITLSVFRAYWCRPVARSLLVTSVLSHAYREMGYQVGAAINLFIDIDAEFFF